MTPMEIWCNESQERYVLGIGENDLEDFKSICKRKVPILCGWQDS